MSSITKRDLVVEISNKSDLTQRQVQEVVQAFIDGVAAHLAKNEEIVLRNFGTFLVKRTEPKVGRNPRKPEVEVKIPARAVVKFKPGKDLNRKVGKLLPKLKK